MRMHRDTIMRKVLQATMFSAEFITIPTNKNSPNQWLLIPLHHLCGFLACYSVIRVGWGFNGTFTD